MFVPYSREQEAKNRSWFLEARDGEGVVRDLSPDCEGGISEGFASGEAIRRDRAATRRGDGRAASSVARRGDQGLAAALEEAAAAARWAAHPVHLQAPQHRSPPSTVPALHQRARKRPPAANPARGVDRVQCRAIRNEVPALHRHLAAAATPERIQSPPPALRPI